jgi:hypothetical protein
VKWRSERIRRASGGVICGRHRPGRAALGADHGHALDAIARDGSEGRRSCAQNGWVRSAGEDSIEGAYREPGANVRQLAATRFHRAGIGSQRGGANRIAVRLPRANHYCVVGLCHGSGRGACSSASDVTQCGASHDRRNCSRWIAVRAHALGGSIASANRRASSATASDGAIQRAAAGRSAAERRSRGHRPAIGSGAAQATPRSASRHRRSCRGTRAPRACG